MKQIIKLNHLQQNMKKLFLLLCIGIPFTSISQTLSPEVLLSTSGNLSNNYAQISWTLGDVQTRTYKVENITITQGFLQSYLTVTDFVEVGDEAGFEINLFPNPVKDVLNLKLSAKKAAIVNFQLYNLNGELIYSKEISTLEKISSLNFSQYQSGTYLLRASSLSNKYIKTFKIFHHD